MSDPVRLTLTLAAASANAICLSQTPAGAGAMTLNGASVANGVATLDVARRVLVTSSGSDASVVFTIKGTNRDKNPASTTVTGVVSGTPVPTTGNFLTVTSITTSAATAGAITVGTDTTGSSAWVLVNPYSAYWSLSAAVQVTGTVTYTVEHTYDDPNKSISGTMDGFVVGANSASPPVVWPHPVLVNLSASQEGQYGNQPIMAHRVTITAGTGSVAFWSLQGGIKS